MDIHSLKQAEGRAITVILNNNNVYSNIIYKVTTEGTIVFTDNKSGQECAVISSFVAMLREEN